MLRTSYLIVIFELRLTRILTLPNIQKKLKYYMWESVEKKERMKKRTGVLRSYRISHREVLPVKSQTCQNYWWTSQKPFLQVMLLICFSSTCKKKKILTLSMVLPECAGKHYHSVLSPLFHWNSSHQCTCSYDLPRTSPVWLNWCQAFPTVAFKKHTHSIDFLTKYLLIHCTYSFPSLLGLLHIW